MSLGNTVNKEKNGALLAYVAENVPDINLRKLLKIVYLLDERFMELRGFPLTWFEYRAWEKGPVAPEVYAVKQGAFGEYVNCSKNQADKYIITPVLQHDYLINKQMEIFSSYEKDIIDNVLSEYKDKSADDLTAITHRQSSLWTRVVAEQRVQFVDCKSDVRIPLEQLNNGDAEKVATYEDAVDYMQFCNASSSC